MNILKQTRSFLQCTRDEVLVQPGYIKTVNILDRLGGGVRLMQSQLSSGQGACFQNVEVGETLLYNVQAVPKGTGLVPAFEMYFSTRGPVHQWKARTCVFSTRLCCAVNRVCPEQETNSFLERRSESFPPPAVCTRLPKKASRITKAEYRRFYLGVTHDAFELIC